MFSFKKIFVYLKQKQTKLKLKTNNNRKKNVYGDSAKSKCLLYINIFSNTFFKYFFVDLFFFFELKEDIF